MRDTARAMSAENVRAFERMVEAVNRGDAERAVRITSEDGLMLAAAFGRHGMSAVFVGLLVVDGLLVLLIMFGPSWARTTPTEPAPVSTWPTHCVEHSGGGNKCPGG